MKLRMSKNNRTSLKRKSSSVRETKKFSLDHVSLIPGLKEPKSKERTGLVLACGQGDCGQLGLGPDVFEKSKPAVVPNLNSIVDIAAGGMHTLCINIEGKVFSWGCNDEGALGRDTSVEGSDSVPDEVILPEKVIQVSAGDSHSAALTETGRVYAWGSFRDSHGSMGLTNIGNEKLPVLLMENISKISSGTDHLLLLTTNGKLYTCGCAEQGQLGRIPERSTNRVSRHGKDKLLMPGLIMIHPRIKHEFNQVWSGSYASFLKEYNTGYIYSFGLNNHFQLGLSEPRPYLRPTLAQSFNIQKSWVEIAGGEHHSIALDSSGQVYALGRKEYGRLGLGQDCEDAKIPTVIPSLQQKIVTSISCGSFVSFAVTDDGDAYGWGMGTSNQLGTGDEEDIYEPKLILGKQLPPKSTIKIASGGQHTVFLVNRE